MSIYLIPTLYSIAGVLLTVMYVAILYSFTKKPASHLIYVFSLTILFFALFAWFISLPVFFANGDMGIIFWGYAAALIVAFGTMYVCLIVQSYLSNTILKNHFQLWKMLILLIGFIAITLHLFFPKEPTTEHGIIIWHANLLTTILVSGTYLVFSFYWTRFFVKFSRMITEPEQKRNILMIAANGLCNGLGSVLVFGSGQWFLTLIGASLYVCGALASLLVFVVIPLFEGSNKRTESPF